MVGARGIEPPLSYENRLLRPVRLPVPPRAPEKTDVRAMNYRAGISACKEKLPDDGRLLLVGAVQEVLPLLGIQRGTALAARDHADDVGDPFRIQVQELEELLPVRVLQEAVRDRVDLHLGGVFVPQRDGL